MIPIGAPLGAIRCMLWLSDFWGFEMKKSAMEEIKKHLQSKQQDIRWELEKNMQAMRSLVDKQTTLKREIAIYQELIRSIDR